VVREIEQVEAARPPVADEVAAEIARLETIAERAEFSSSVWLSANPGFNVGAFNDSVLGAMMLLDPNKVRQLVSARVKRQAEAWTGMRLAPAEKERRLAKLRNDLRVARARLEVIRREVEQQTGEVLPRTNDDPGVWLLMADALNQLAASGGRK
jgi:hypothetical protein